MPSLVRYFDLGGADDVDPILTQPPEDTYGDLITGFGGQILINAWEVDDAGEPATPTGGLLLTMGVVTLSQLSPERRPDSSPTNGLVMKRWGRGPLALLTEAGEWRIQAELSEVVAFTVVITAHTVVANRQLAIWATRGPRP